MKVFISSTYKDLIDYRAAAIQAVEGTSYHAVKMEVFGARPEEPLAACLNEVEQSDLFIGIYAHRYGFMPVDSNVSITEMEYDHARKLGKPIYCFVVDEEQDWKPKWIEGEPGKSKLESFKDRIRKLHTCSFFTSPEDLGMKVAHALSRYVATKALKSPRDASGTRGRARGSKRLPTSEINVVDKMIRLNDLSRRIEGWLKEIEKIVGEEFDIFSGSFSKMIAKMIVSEVIEPTLMNFSKENIDLVSIASQKIESEFSNWCSTTKMGNFVKIHTKHWFNQGLVRIKKTTYPVLDLEYTDIDTDDLIENASNSVLLNLNGRISSMSLDDGRGISYLDVALLLINISTGLLPSKFSSHSQLARLNRIENKIHEVIRSILEENTKQIIVDKIVGNIKRKFDEKLELLME